MTVQLYIVMSTTNFVVSLLPVFKYAHDISVLTQKCYCSNIDQWFLFHNANTAVFLYFIVCSITSE